MKFSKTKSDYTCNIISYLDLVSLACAKRWRRISVVSTDDTERCVYPTLFFLTFYLYLQSHIGFKWFSIARFVFVFVNKMETLIVQDGPIVISWIVFLVLICRCYYQIGRIKAPGEYTVSVYFSMMFLRPGLSFISIKSVTMLTVNNIGNIKILSQNISFLTIVVHGL